MPLRVRIIFSAVVTLAAGIFIITMFIFAIEMGGCGSILGDYCDLLEVLVPILGAVIISFFEYIILKLSFTKKTALLAVAFLILMPLLVTGYSVYREYTEEKAYFRQAAEMFSQLQDAKTINDCSDFNYGNKRVCLMMVAIRTKDLKACSTLKELNSYDNGSCTTLVEQAKIGTLSNKLCDYAAEDGRITEENGGNVYTIDYKKNECYYYVGIFLKDEQLCEKSQFSINYPQCSEMIRKYEPHMPFTCWLRSSCTTRWRMGEVS